MGGASFQTKAETMIQVVGGDLYGQGQMLWTPRWLMVVSCPKPFLGILMFFSILFVCFVYFVVDALLPAPSALVPG